MIKLHLLTRTLLVLSLAILASCQQSSDKNAAENSAQKIDLTPNSDHTITVVTLKSPNTYFVNSNEEFAGLEYDLAKLFVAELGPEYQLKWIAVDDFTSVLPTLLTQKADIAAADITVTDRRKSVVNFSVAYHDVQQQVVYNRDVSTPPRSIKSLAGQTITVPAGTSFVERLQKINLKEPTLSYTEAPNSSSSKLIEALANNEIDYTIADNHLLSLMQYYYPNVGMGFSIGEPEKIAWAFRKDGRPDIEQKANEFFKKIKQNGVLRNLTDRYHGNTKRLNPFDVKTFLGASQQILPKYKRLFKDAQEVTGIDWRLLASISYQESHWDTFNTSPTNVRGLMMLTEDTSDLMKVTDRLDPKQSIPAGAKFFLWLKERFPERMEDQDRTYMALASYNIGFGHVEDARVLAQRLNLNPDSWADVKKALILLTEPKYYAKAKHGFCNCGAPVIYTESIRSYYQIMEKHQPKYEPEPYQIANAL